MDYLLWIWQNFEKVDLEWYSCRFLFWHHVSCRNSCQLSAKRVSWYPEAIAHSNLGWFYYNLTTWCQALQHISRWSPVSSIYHYKEHVLSYPFLLLSTILFSSTHAHSILRQNRCQLAKHVIDSLWYWCSIFGTAFLGIFRDCIRRKVPALLCRCSFFL